MACGAWPGFEPMRRATISDPAPLVWRAPEGAAAVPVGGGGAWPGFEATRRAKLAARTSRGRAAAHRHTQRPGPPAPETPVGPRWEMGGIEPPSQRGGRKSGGGQARRRPENQRGHALWRWGESNPRHKA